MRGYSCVWFILVTLQTSVLVRSQPVTVTDCNAASYTMTFTYRNDGTKNPRYIFAEDNANCGKGKITGDGTPGNEYTLNVIATDTNDAQNCGIEETDVATETHQFIVQTKFGPTLISGSADDKNYTVTCSFSPAPPPRHPVVAQYACDAGKMIQFFYLNGLNTPADIYAFDKKGTCGMSAQSGNGTGSAIDRFELNIDLSGATQTPDCGALETSPNVYEVRIIIQSTEHLIKFDDALYTLVCNFSNPSISVSTIDATDVGDKLTNENATELEGQATLRLFDENDQKASRIQLGAMVHLVVDLSNSDAEGVHVSGCVTKPSLSAILQVELLGNDGCQTGDNLVSSFSGSTPGQAKTQPFRAFRFDDVNTVTFTCQVRFCYTANATKCSGNHCVNGRRRRRETEDEQTESLSVAVVVVSGGTLSQGQDGNDLDGQTTESCGSNFYTLVIALFVVLSCLLLLVTCLVVYYFLHLRRKSKASKQ